MNVFKAEFTFTNESKLKRKSAYILILLLLLIAIMHTFSNSLGRFSHSVNVNDSAFAAKFNIDIITPDELSSVSSDNHYQYYFPMQGDVISFAFKISNNSEVAVICHPHINNGIRYHVILDGVYQNEFVLNSGEAINFQLIVLSDGLNTNITQSSLLLDITQLEGE